MRLMELARTAGVAARNVLLGANLRALPLLLRPRSLIHYTSESLFLYKTTQGARALPQRNIADVLQGESVETLKLGSLEQSSWLEPVASYASDIVSLCLLCRRIRPQVIFEIGTLNGYTAYHFALNSDARVYTLDLPKDNGAGVQLRTTAMDDAHINASRSMKEYCFTGTTVEGRVHTLFGDSATFDFSPYHAEVDLFFIDGAHSYEYVRADTENALKCVRPGGVIAWHDYGRVGVNGVSRFLHELSARGHEIYAVPGGSVAFMQVKSPQRG
jgi:predicted O-methyltransferase YrrM